MIVISGALVLVALVLLVIGIVGPELGFVYASIAVSLVSLVFLVIGILQRRGETLPAAPAGAPAPTAHVEDPAQDLTAVQPSGTRPTTPEPAPLAASAADELETGGTVLVVAGRPRYHVAGCRYLSGKDAEAIDVLDAREEGFTPCGVCRPDDALLALQAEEGAPAAELEAPAPLELEEVEASTPTRVAKAPVASRRSTPSKPPSKAPARTPAKAAARAPRAVPEPLVAAPVVEPAVVEPAVVESSLPEPAVPVQAPVAPVAPVAEPAPARRAAKVATAVPAVGAVAAVAAVTAVKAAKATAKTPVKAPAPARAAAPAKTVAPARSSAKAPVTAAVPAVDSAPTPAAARAGSVVVIPDRGRFHRAECRYVRGVEGAEVLSKAAATRQGYDACGVCKP